MTTAAIRNDRGRYVGAGRDFGARTGGGTDRARPRNHIRADAIANLLEVGIVMQARRGNDGARDLDLLLATLRVDTVAVTANQAAIARKAFRRYGRGRNAANLNFSDCFAYALAKDKSAPLLFKGDDFARTDVIAAPY
jgi:ribonuclease VapC